MLCEDKKKLKEERESARNLRKKIVGVDEKMKGDSMGLGNMGMGNRLDNNFGNRGNGFGGMGSYDTYQTGSSLNDKLGDIMAGVNKMEDKMKKDDL